MKIEADERIIVKLVRDKIGDFFMILLIIPIFGMYLYYAIDGLFIHT